MNKNIFGLTIFIAFALLTNAQFDGVLTRSILAELIPDFENREEILLYEKNISSIDKDTFMGLIKRKQLVLSVNKLTKLDLSTWQI
jgi:hypothetical protein